MATPINFPTNFILPKQISEIIYDLLRQCVRYWYISISAIALSILFNYVLDNQYLGAWISYKFIGITIGWTISLIALYAIFKLRYKKTAAFEIAIYGCYTAEKDFVLIDTEAQYWNDHIASICKSVHDTHFTFRQNIIQVKFIEIPNFLVIIWGITRLNRFIKRRNRSDKHLASLHFIRAFNGGRITPYINCTEEIQNSALIDNAMSVLSTFSTDKSAETAKVIEISTKTSLLLFSQMLNDFLFNENNFQEVHYILDDSLKLILNIKNDTSFLSSNSKSALGKLLDFWEGYIEQYKTTLLIEQNELNGALKHLFKSISLNPYYPYDSYNALKHDYTKIYVLNMAPLMKEVSDEVEKIDPKFDSKLDLEQIDFVSEQLSQQVAYIDVPFLYILIQRILKTNPPQRVVDQLILRLNDLDENIPFNLMIKCESIKYIKAGNEKLNEIYVGRLDECIRLMRKIIAIDNEFPLARTKLATYLLFKGVHFGNDTFLEEAGKEYDAGLHYMAEMGYEIRTKTS